MADLPDHCDDAHHRKPEDNPGGKHKDHTEHNSETDPCPLDYFCYHFGSLIAVTLGSPPPA
jgi:hypothetical protein